MGRKQKILLGAACALLAASVVLFLAGWALYRGDAAPESTPTPVPAASPTPTPTPVPTATPYVPAPPEITLQGEDPLVFPAQPVPYEDPGCTAWDALDGDLTEAVECTISVDPYRAGEGEVVYTVTDSEGLTAGAVRRVIVTAAEPPETVFPGGRVIYLTFDDGPSMNTDRLLSVLDAYGVKATWFVTNTHPDYTDRIRAIAERGHTVAVHSATHNYGTIYRSEEAFFADFREMQEIIHEQTGVYTTLLRFPGGSSNTASCYNPGIMTRLTECLADMGYTYFDWNVTAADTAPDANYYTVIENVTEGVSRNAVSVVLQHDTNGFSVDAVEAIVQWGLGNGYTFLPLDATSPTAHHGLNN